MTRILVAAALILVAVTLYSFFDCLARDRARIRVLPKWGWLLVIVLVPVFGLLLWFLFGRSSFGTGAAGSTAFGKRRQKGPVAPDDDPEYLQRIADEVEQTERRKRREAMEHPQTRAQQQSPEQARDLDPHEAFEQWLAEREGPDGTDTRPKPDES